LKTVPQIDVKSQRVVDVVDQGLEELAATSRYAVSAAIWVAFRETEV
jgi:hypothetical protein